MSALPAMSTSAWNGITAGPTGYTTAHRPWSVVVTIEFAMEGDAMRFEKYLKSGSGRAFAKRHFAPAFEE
jgi:predicted GIY-YIG superfamily endonuclease